MQGETLSLLTDVCSFEDASRGKTVCKVVALVLSTQQEQRPFQHSDSDEERHIMAQTRNF